jgi:hypothetical protein
LVYEESKQSNKGYSKRSLLNKQLKYQQQIIASKNKFKIDTSTQPIALEEVKILMVYDLDDNLKVKESCAKLNDTGDDDAVKVIQSTNF